jgi:hypothetical protein
MKNYMEKWSKDDKEKLTRVWRPEGFTGEKEKVGGESDEATEDN